LHESRIAKGGFKTFYVPNRERERKKWFKRKKFSIVKGGLKMYDFEMFIKTFENYFNV